MSFSESSQPVEVFDSSYSCLFVGSVGLLFRVYCPFRVCCQVPYPPYQAGEMLQVDRIGATAEFPILYRIDRDYVPHQYFRLIL